MSQLTKPRAHLHDVQGHLHWILVWFHEGLLSNLLLLSSGWRPVSARNTDWQSTGEIHKANTSDNKKPSLFVMEQQGKTRIKSFRLNGRTIEGLAKAAKRARMTESRFLNELLEARLIVDPLLPAFQEIILGVDSFQAILNAADGDKLEAAAADVARRNMPLVRELYESSGRSLDFRGFITDVLARYGHWFAVEGNINKVLGWVTLRHGHGPKWSRFLRGYLTAVYSTFSEEKLNITLHDQFVRIGFEINSQEK